MIAEALDTDDPAAAVWDLAHRVGAPTKLSDLGFARQDIAIAANRLVTAQFANPRRPQYDDIATLLDAARVGTRPVSEKAT